MGAISFTAHVSNKKSGITSKTKLEGVAKHNLRKYKSDGYSADNIFVLQGTTNLVKYVKAVYHQEFDEALKIYNENQTRADRRIPDYYEHVAKKEQDMAVELIVKIGDREYWKQNNGNKAYAKMIYRRILKELGRLLPEFVVANAVVHMDEDSPHMHIVGVPVATGYKKGLSKQVSKRRVFTREVLSEVLQDKLREFANKEVELLFGEQIREKSKGRNHDLSVAEYKVAKETEHYEELRELTQSEQYKCNELERLADSKQERCDMLESLAESKWER